MRISKTAAVIVGVVAALGLTKPATAAPIFADTFSAAGLQGAFGAPGYFFFIGHNATQTYTGTGLASVDELTLTLTPTAGPSGSFNYASEPIGFTFYLNGFNVGTSTWNPGDSTAHALDFTFAPQSSPSTDWTVLMSVTQPVCVGCGAIHFGIDNPLTLSAVPEPGSLALLATGIAAASVRRLRRRNG